MAGQDCRQLESVLTQNCHAAGKQSLHCDPSPGQSRKAGCQHSGPCWGIFWIKDCQFSVYQLERTETHPQMAKTSSSARKEQEWTVTEQTEAAETQPRKGQVKTLLKSSQSKIQSWNSHSHASPLPLLELQDVNKTPPSTLHFVCMHSFFLRLKREWSSLGFLILSSEHNSHLQA